MALLCAATPAFADNDRELKALREEVAALAQTVKTLQTQLHTQENRWANFNAPTTAALPGSASADEVAALRDEVAALRNDRPAPGQRSTTGLFNPDISGAVDFITSYSKEANQWNFTLRNVELMVQQNIDTYARAVVTLNAESELVPTENRDLFEHTSINVEEAFIETTSLPGGLQLRAGQFFADFSRLGKVHSHDLPFVDRPPSLDAILGGETQARGFELNWVPPTQHYFRLSAGLVDKIGHERPITNRLGLAAVVDEHGHDHEAGEDHGHDHGEAAFRQRENRPFKSLTAYVRGATLFELGQQTILRVGADYAQNSQGTKRQIASADAKLEWQPDPASYDLLEAGAEGLWTREHGTLADDALPPTGSPNGSATAWGGYAYAQYRFGKRWQPGLRVDYLHTDTYAEGTANANGRESANLWTWSTYLSYHLSETNRLRFQLNYVTSDRQVAPNGSRDDLQAFLQWTVLFGPHKHPFMP